MHLLLAYRLHASRDQHGFVHDFILGTSTEPASEKELSNYTSMWLSGWFWNKESKAIETT